MDETADCSFAALIETIRSDIIMISFSQYITEIQGHRHGPFSFPNFKETGLFVVSLDYVGGSWLDKHLPQVIFLWVYEAMKVFLNLLNETTVNQQKKTAVTIQLCLEKWLSKNNSISSQQFYSLNEFTTRWVLQQNYNLFTPLYSLVLQHQHRRERRGAVTIITSPFNE